MGKAASVKWTGMAELSAELRALPDSCAAEAGTLVQSIATAAYADIKAAYPVRTGNLKNGMRIGGLQRKGWRVAVTVQNVAPHALIFENGTQARHYFTKNGKQHLTGRMPPGHVFQPRIERAKRALLAALKAMVLHHGATSVTGD